MNTRDNYHIISNAIVWTRYLEYWAKYRRLVLNAVKPNVYCETYLKIFLPSDPIHVYPAQVDVIMLICRATLCANLQKLRYRP